MAKVTFKGFYKDTDPIYQEGFSIMGLKKSKEQSKSSLTSSELNTLREETMEYLEQQAKERMKGGSMQSQMDNPTLSIGQKALTLQKLIPPIMGQALQEGNQKIKNPRSKLRGIQDAFEKSLAKPNLTLASRGGVLDP